MPRLSIAIPTRQRRPLLEETLRSVVEDAESLGCEVVVSDNDSSDGTRDFLRSFASQHPVVRPHFQSHNVGLDKNMRDVTGRCSSDYVWLLGDDDVATPGAIGRILALVEREPDLVVLQATIATARLDPIEVVLPKDVAGKTVTDPATAFELAWNRMPFGTVVARREHLAADGWERYLGTSHAYTGVVWSALAGAAGTGRRVRVEFSREPDVLLRNSEKSWRADETRIYLEQIPRWFQLLPPLYRVQVERAFRDHQRQVSRVSALVKRRARGEIDLGYITDATKEFRLLPRLRALAISALPVGVARTMDGWRTRFHERRRSVVARLRALW